MLMLLRTIHSAERATVWACLGVLHPALLLSRPPHAPYTPGSIRARPPQPPRPPFHPLASLRLNHPPTRLMQVYTHFPPKARAARALPGPVCTQVRPSQPLPQPRWGAHPWTKRLYQSCWLPGTSNYISSRPRPSTTRRYQARCFGDLGEHQMHHLCLTRLLLPCHQSQVTSCAAHHAAILSKTGPDPPRHTATLRVDRPSRATAVQAAAGSSPGRPAAASLRDHTQSLETQACVPLRPTHLATRPPLEVQIYLLQVRLWHTRHLDCTTSPSRTHCSIIGTTLPAVAVVRLQRAHQLFHPPQGLLPPLAHHRP